MKPRIGKSKNDHFLPWEFYRGPLDPFQNDQEKTQSLHPLITFQRGLHAFHAGPNWKGSAEYNEIIRKWSLRVPNRIFIEVFFPSFVASIRPNVPVAYQELDLKKLQTFLGAMKRCEKLLEAYGSTRLLAPAVTYWEATKGLKDFADKIILTLQTTLKSQKTISSSGDALNVHLAYFAFLGKALGVSTHELTKDIKKLLYFDDKTKKVEAIKISLTRAFERYQKLIDASRGTKNI